MNNTIDYEEIKKNLKYQIAVAKECEELNNYLKQFNWIFLQPIVWVRDFDRLKDLKYKNNASNSDILKILVDVYFNSRILAIHMEAFYRKIPFIKPFSFLIEHSFVLSFQKDYAGAINTLLPVVEGIIRRYLLDEKGKEHHEIMKSKYLIAGVNSIKDDILIKAENKFSLYANLNQQQKKQLRKYKLQQLDIWFSIFTNYLSNNLYFDTRDGQSNDILNRHSIFHCFTNEIYYNLSNYIKVFSCIQFLTWAFIELSEDTNLIPNIEEKQYIDTWKSYEEIQKISIGLVKIKTELFKRQNQFDESDYLIEYPNTKILEYINLMKELDKLEATKNQ